MAVVCAAQFNSGLRGLRNQMLLPACRSLAAQANSFIQKEGSHFSHLSEKNLQ